MKVTNFENELLWALRDMVAQHIDLEDENTTIADWHGPRFSGFISANSRAMRLLCDAGHMHQVHDGGGRVFTAQFVPEGLTPNAHGKKVGIPWLRLLLQRKRSLTVK